MNSLSPTLAAVLVSNDIAFLSHLCLFTIPNWEVSMLVQFVQWDATICETPRKVTGQSGAVTDDITLLPIKRPTLDSTLSVVNFFFTFHKTLL